MKSVRALKGLPVILAGRRVGRVSGVRLDGGMTRVQGIWMDAGIAGGRYLKGEEIELLGDVSVLASSRGRREKNPGRPLLFRAISADGQRLGAVTDVFVDADSLRVRAVELSRGFFDDLTQGRSSVPEFAVRQDGEIVVGAPPEGGKEP